MLITEALAATETAPVVEVSPMAGFFVQLVLVFAFFYFLFIRLKQRNIKNEKTDLIPFQKGVIRWILAILIGYLFVDIHCLTLERIGQDWKEVWLSYSCMMLFLLVCYTIKKAKITSCVKFIIFVFFIGMISLDVYNDLVKTEEFNEKTAVLGTMIVMCLFIWCMYTFFFFMQKAIDKEENKLLDEQLEKIKELTNLKIIGKISEEEFLKQKNEILQKW